MPYRGTTVYIQRKITLIIWGVQSVELTEVVASLQLGESQAVLASEWEASQASLPSSELFFLEPSYVANACRYTHVPQAAAEAAMATAGRVAADPALCALAWHYYHCLRSVTYPRTTMPDWPSLDHILPGESGLFSLLVLLACVPHVKAIYEQHSVPETVASDTMADVGRWVSEHYRQHGYWGVTRGNVGWLASHFRGELFHLVRLQFQVGVFQGQVRAFRHRRQGTVLALSEGGLCYRQDGQMNGAGGVTETVGLWESRLELSDDGALGNPILPVGRALASEIWLPRDEWEQVLAPGDPVLYLHIPAGSRLDFEQCGQSFRASLEFFPRHFPELEFTAFAAGSWLLDSQLEMLLPPQANLVRFLREFYLCPIRSAGREALRRVFGSVPEDLTRAPRDTTLRRALIDHLLEGGHWRGGGAFLLREDLDWGQQVYREQVLPW